MLSRTYWSLRLFSRRYGPSLAATASMSCRCKAQVAVDTGDGENGNDDNGDVHVHACGKVVKHSESAWMGALKQPIKSPYKKTFYKRTLPTPPCIDFASDEGKQVFQEAMIAGHMNGFFKLIQQFTTQAEPAWCGLTSLCVVMNALEIDPKRIWKGAWRWYAEDMLDCCKPLAQVTEEGITLQQAACLAQCNASQVSLHQSGTFSYEEFRRAVLDATASGTEHLIVSYSRKSFLQTGDGHFSPVGGFHPGRDLVLILDTARFKYPPHWVPLSMLYDAMAPIDSTTGKPRGYLKLSARSRRFSLLFKLSIRGDWEDAHHFATAGCQGIVAAALAQGKDAASILRDLVAAVPIPSMLALIRIRCLETACNTSLPLIQQQVLHELRHLPLYSTVESALQALDISNATEEVEEAAPNGTSVEDGVLDSPSIHASPSVAEMQVTEEAESSATTTHLLAERCLVLLSLCVPALQKCGDVLSGWDASARVPAGADASSVADASSAERGGASEQHAAGALGEGGEDGAGVGCSTESARTLAELIATLNSIQQSSLVTDEVTFLARQMPSLHILDGSKDSWPESYYECRMCTSKCA